MIDLHSKTYISWHFMKSALATHRRNFKLCAKNFVVPLKGNGRTDCRSFFWHLRRISFVRSERERLILPRKAQSWTDADRDRQSVSPAADLLLLFHFPRTDAHGYRCSALRKAALTREVETKYCSYCLACLTACLPVCPSAKDWPCKGNLRYE